MQASNDPLHGKTLEAILNELVAHYGWDYMGEMIAIRCFTSNPSIKSSLTFLRKTPWARTKVEQMYVSMVKKNTKKTPLSFVASLTIKLLSIFSHADKGGIT